uniref:Uncharacterized protein n=1 Tax=Glossina palpalis gambiensis TaxID=67801 RepID=A0A1B0AWJ5_9MUSC
MKSVDVMSVERLLPRNDILRIIRNESNPSSGWDFISRKLNADKAQVIKGLSSCVMENAFLKSFTTPSGIDAIPVITKVNEVLMQIKATSNKPSKTSKSATLPGGNFIYLIIKLCIAVISSLATRSM